MLKTCGKLRFRAFQPFHQMLCMLKHVGGVKGRNNLQRNSKKFCELCYFGGGLCSSYFHFIHLHFLPSSSTSVSFLLLLPHLLFPILSPLSSYKFFCSLLLFLDFTFSSSLFILFFSLYLLLIPIGFLHFLVYSSF